MKQKQTCENCFYSRKRLTLECRRYAPRPFQNKTGYEYVLYAEVSSNFWCGEWDHERDVYSKK